MSRVRAFAAAAVMSVLGLPAAAQQALDFEFVGADVRNFVSLALGVVPDYTGSDDYVIGVAPSFKWHFDGTERYARLLATEFSANIVNSRTWTFGPLMNYRFGRDDVEDAAVDRLREIDSGFELGAFAGWTWIAGADPRQRFNATLQYLHDVSGDHDGYLITAATRYWHPVSRPLTLTLGASTTYGSGNYMRTFFGIDADNSARSGLPVFGAESGIRDVRISPGLVYSFSPSWHLGAGFIYSRLIGDAEDSPVVATRGSANQFFAGAGIVYAW
jgi:MipA family protein